MKTSEDHLQKMEEFVKRLANVKTLVSYNTLNIFEEARQIIEELDGPKTDADQVSEIINNWGECVLFDGATVVAVNKSKINELALLCLTKGRELEKAGK